MDSRPTEEQTLFHRRLGNASLKSLKCELQTPAPVHSNACDVDLDAFKIKPDIKKWISKTALKISCRPCLTFSPSLLLSPLSFSPVMTNDGPVSPFVYMNQLITAPQIPTDSYDTSGKLSRESVFTFDAEDYVLPSSSTGFQHGLCTIPEDRELTIDDIDIEGSPDWIHNKDFKARKSFSPPMSPSIAIATRSRKSSTVQQKSSLLPRSEVNENRTNQRNVTESKRNDSSERKTESEHSQRKNNTADFKGIEAKRKSRKSSMFLSMVSN